MADADDTALSMPRSRAQALIGVARSVVSGELDLDPGADRDDTHKRLLAHRGIGPWTADYIVMRAFGHPDVMIEDDLYIRRMLDSHGIDAARTTTLAAVAFLRRPAPLARKRARKDPLMTTRWMDSPIGGLRLHANAGLITAIDFDARPRRTRAADPLLDDAERQLTEYFAGDRTSFDLPLASEGSEFQKKVWGELQRIPFGETASYGDVARRARLRAGDLPGRRCRQRGQPDPDHRAVPPRHRFGRHSDGIRRWHRAQEDAAGAGAAGPVLTSPLRPRRSSGPMGARRATRCRACGKRASGAPRRCDG